MFGYGAQIPPETAIRNWEREMRAIGALADQLFWQCRHAEELYKTNKLDGVIGATSASANKLCGDSTLTKDAANAAKAFNDQFIAWMQTTITIPDINGPVGTKVEPLPPGVEPEALTASATPLFICSTRPKVPYVAPNVAPLLTPIAPEAEAQIDEGA